MLFCGDVHGCFDHVIEAVREYSPDAVVFLGDLQPQRSLELELTPILEHTDVWWIHGNHDTDSDADYNNLFGSALADRNLHGRVVEIAGIRVAGLGGVFRGQVWTPPAEWAFESAQDYCARCVKGNQWRGGLLRKHRTSIFPADYFGLMRQRADVLVTHEAPSCHPYGFQTIDELARGLRAGKVFHGHHHDRLDYTGDRARLGFEAFGVGFCGITDLAGTSVKDGDFDDARSGRARRSMT
jgi:predicted phosphodiesterase